MRLQNMVITAILRQISIPNSNTKNLRTCFNIVFQYFFLKSYITRDISGQSALWSGWVGSLQKWVQWVKKDSGHFGPNHFGHCHIGPIFYHIGPVFYHIGPFFDKICPTVLGPKWLQNLGPIWYE